MPRCQSLFLTWPLAICIGHCLAVLSALLVDDAHAQSPAPAASYQAGPYSSLSPATGGPYPVRHTPAPYGMPPSSTRSVATVGNTLPTSASWIVPTDGDYGSYVDADVYCEVDPYSSAAMNYPSSSDVRFWQILPEGLIYRSYQAGMHESRTGIVLHEADGNAFWDAALGARLGLLRFGNGAVFRPQGWQLDFEGAALPRLTLDDMRDLESVDFRAGVPLTYGVGDWQFKIGYYHLSSHMGDEFAIRNGALGDRINYVRDSLVFGVSYYPVPVVRVYTEAGYALYALGGAEPWEFQFGTEISQAGPTGLRGTPFLAMNVHLREDHKFGGDVTAQAGWLWRGVSGQTMRFGVHYFNGKSSQYQFFNNSEEQIGVGLWYDF